MLQNAVNNKPLPPFNRQQGRNYRGTTLIQGFAALSRYSFNAAYANTLFSGQLQQRF